VQELSQGRAFRPENLLWSKRVGGKNLAMAATYDFNELENRARAFKEAGRFRDAMAIYFFMGDGDPSLDAGYLAARIGECHEALGDRHAARWWYGRALEENPHIAEYQGLKRKLESVGFDELPSN
jgi:tetratricopeptide (TPR) repeat protein